MYPMAPHVITSDDIPVTRCRIHSDKLRFYDATYTYDDAKSIKIRLKTCCHTIPASRFVFEHTIEGTLVCSTASIIVEAMVIGEVYVLFVQALVVFQFVFQTTFLESGLMMWLLDPLRSCGWDVCLHGC